MQVLYETSAENPSTKGLGFIQSPVERFDDTDKAVPHMGWNSVQHLDPTAVGGEMAEDEHFYFVHSYRVKYDTEAYPDAAEWAYTTTQYGQEVFVSSVGKGNVFGTQFHPEKSGPAGLKLLNTWLSKSEDERKTLPSNPRAPRQPRRKDGLTKRIIACMDVRANDDGDLVVTKGDQYDVREKVLPAPTITSSSEMNDLTNPSATTQTTSSSLLPTKTAGAVRNLGKPVALAARYADAGADELCLLNITSFRHSPLHDQPMLAVVRAAAESVFVPLTIGGGIKDSVDPDGTKRSALEVAGAYFRAGADKVSIGSEAVYAVERLRAGSKDGTSAIETIARAYGCQAVVVSVDPRRAYVDPETYDGPYKSELVHGTPDGPEEERGKAWWYQCTVSGGRENRQLSAVELCQGAEELGAGELLVNSIDRDGTGRGFDLDLIKMVKRAVRIPVVASSGAGSADHFVEVFDQTDVESALAAGIFHRGEVNIADVKQALDAAGIGARR
jgi:imidazole glycerol-phosphate synthase